MIWWLEYVVDVGVGFLHQGMSWLFPFRKQTGQREVAWDVVGIVATSLFATAAYLAFDPLLGVIYQTAWLADWRSLVQQWPVALTVACYTVLTDWAVYWAHRLLHSKALWCTHAWHHAPRFVYWASGLRGSPVHIAITLAPASLVYLALPFDGYGTVIAVVSVFHIVNQHYLHSNIWLPGQRVLEWVFVTPRFHFVHHSSTPTRTNSNYGFVFSFWDRLHGSYVDPDTVPADDELGLDYELGNVRLLLGLPPRPRIGEPRLAGSPTSSADIR